MLQVQGTMFALPGEAETRGRVLAVARLEFRYFTLATGWPCRHEASLMDLFERVSVGEPLDFGDADRREAG